MVQIIVTLCVLQEPCSPSIAPVPALSFRRHAHQAVGLGQGKLVFAIHIESTTTESPKLLEARIHLLWPQATVRPCTNKYIECSNFKCPVLSETIYHLTGCPRTAVQVCKGLYNIHSIVDLDVTVLCGIEPLIFAI